LDVGKKPGPALLMLLDAVPWSETIKEAGLLHPRCRGRRYIGCVGGGGKSSLKCRAMRTQAAPAHPCARGIPFILNIKNPLSFWGLSGFEFCRALAVFLMRPQAEISNRRRSAIVTKSALI